MQFYVFLCHSWRLKMFLATFDFDHTCIKKWCYASVVYELKSGEISNQMFANIAIRYCKIKLFCGAFRMVCLINRRRIYNPVNHWPYLFFKNFGQVTVILLNLDKNLGCKKIIQTPPLDKKFRNHARVGSGTTHFQWFD